VDRTSHLDVFLKSVSTSVDEVLAVAIAKLPDMDALALELVQLERRELDISARRRKLHDRLNSFPNEFTQRLERELSDERHAIHDRIDQLKSTACAATPILGLRAVSGRKASSPETNMTFRSI
jgi:hypothetical protein